MTRKQPNRWALGAAICSLTLLLGSCEWTYKEDGATEEVVAAALHELREDRVQVVDMRAVVPFDFSHMRVYLDGTRRALVEEELQAKWWNFPEFKTVGDDVGVAVFLRDREIISSFVYGSGESPNLGSLAYAGIVPAAQARVCKEYSSYQGMEGYSLRYCDIPFDGPRP